MNKPEPPTESDREFLEAEVADSLEILTTLPPTHLVERSGFERRLADARAKLALLSAERRSQAPTPPRGVPQASAEMTDDELTRLEALLVGTTDGPWEDKNFDGFQRTTLGPKYDGGKQAMVAIVSGNKPNAAFVAASRAAVPALIAEARRLRATELQRDAMLDVLRLIAQGPCLCDPPSDPPEPPSCPSCFVRHEIDRDVPVGSTASLVAMQRDIRRLREERDHYREKYLALVTKAESPS